MKSSFLLRLSGVVFLCLVAISQAQIPSTRPVAGLRVGTPQVHALTGGRVVVAPGEVLDKATIVIRDGLIEAVGADVAVPDDAREWDISGQTVYAGLIDAYGETTLPGSESFGAPYWNSHVQPERDVARHYQANDSENKTLRSQGVTARLVAPSDGIIKGTSALVSTGSGDGSRTILKDRVALHLRLTTSRGRSGYPSSPMGAVALARQAMYDTQWYSQAWQAYMADRRLPRPERNDALETLDRYVSGQMLAIADTSNQLYALRADRYAREFGLNLVLRGSGREYRRLDAIRSTGRTVIVPVDFPKAPNVATPEAAANATLEALMHWDIAPENPGRLVKAGVPIVLTSDGLDNKGTFLKSVRTAVERGLDAEKALAALTVEPARLYGVEDRLGTIAAGKLAHLLVTDGDLFAEKTKVLATWVDGQRFEIEKKSLIDVSGDWLVSVEGSDDVIVKLTGKPKKLSGEIQLGDKKIKTTHAAMRDARLAATFPGKEFGREGVARVSAVVSAAGGKATSWQGTIVWPDGSESSVTAGRTESKEAKPDEEEEDKEKETEKEKKEIDHSASYAVNFPLGAMGRDAQPVQSETIVFQNATIWTSAEAGILENGSVLVSNGLIVAVGTNLEIPEGTQVVDATGMHLSPGIIDCHSHIATDGGVNEGTQAITAEVRIGDFIDSRSISIYRQMAGGVTSSNILHGSANPIGGQNQVIKLRWGALPEAMKFADAPGGIKFALGENVKRSNSTRNSGRYPTSRMGVEQIVRDAFAAANDYRQQWKTWHEAKRGLPPRRDLELDALVEILEHKRWIHCHSYRQDEILALIRTLDDLGVQIGTFQHILEGYKVAKEMAEHGAMGSSFSDWWAYKIEVYDAIPYNGTLMHESGVVVSFNSDDAELARHLNHEAAKAVKYGGISPAEALKFVTLNPARQLRIDQYVGSIEPGKHADLVLWSGSPLSTLSRCEQTWIDGRKYFDRASDQEERRRFAKMHNRLVQKILTGGAVMLSEGEKNTREEELWPNEDIYCHAHNHSRSR